VTALQTVEPKAPSTDANRPSRAQQVTAALANTRDKLEAPFRLAEEIYKIEEAGPGGQFRLSLSPPTPGTMRGAEIAQQWRAFAPATDDLRARRDLLLKAKTTPADPASARLTIGLLLSAFPNAGKEPKDEFFATMLHDVVDEGHSPYILAEACKLVRRKAKFVPAVAEVLGECGSVSYKLGTAVDYAERLVAMGEACDAVVAAENLPAVEWSEALWTAALHEYAHHVIWGDRFWPARLGPRPGQPGCMAPVHLFELVGLSPAKIAKGLEPAAEAA
jgi:hypothetical protein